MVTHHIEGNLVPDFTETDQPVPSNWRGPGQAVVGVMDITTIGHRYSNDGVLRSRREIPVVQLVGYRVLGIGIVISGLALFVAVLRKFRGSPLGVAELLALVFAGAMTAVFLWYGWYLIKRVPGKQ